MRSQIGQTQALSAIAILVAGGFLLSHIGSTHALNLHLGILGSAGLIGGLALLVLAARDVFGQLVISESGISIRPMLVGRTVAWDELDRWKIDFYTEHHPEANSVLLWTASTSAPMVIPNGWLSYRDRIHVHKLLTEYAPEKEIEAQ